MHGYMPSGRGLAVALALLLVATACASKNAPVARPVPPPSSESTSTAGARPPSPPEPVLEPTTAVPPEPLRDERVSSASLDDLNRESPLRPVFFDLDSSELTAEGQRSLAANVSVMRANATWTITIEGHCDERGTAEYNLALGERRALSARAYLVSLGLPADRLRTVSYGKEFPFDPGHDEGAWAKNRRAHFVITAK